MHDLNSNASPSSSWLSSPRMSPITRLRHARHVHKQLQERKRTDQSSSHASGVDEEKMHLRRANGNCVQLSVADGPFPNDDRRTVAPASVEALAQDLQRSWRKLQQAQNPSASCSLVKRVEKIGANEKDALIVHLLQRTALLETQRNDVVAVGEKLTTQLVQQQHELRVQVKSQTTQLHEQLQQALHHHPEVARLEEQMVQLQNANQECEQKLLFAVQKLHRSRQRERALRREQESDPLLWDL